MTNDLSGKVVKSYEIHELIGEGGFGAVFRAVQPTIQREVAIKIILPNFANQADFIRRFEAEAQIVARLEHPHITPLYDYWRDPTGAYLVMRYLRAGSLRRSLVQSGAWSLAQVARMLNQVASALAFSHVNGVIHGDVKTDNILLDELGNAYLSDFGIAKVLSEQESSLTLQGTIASLAPEQIRGERASVHSDVYSLGILVFETLTGHKPFFDESSSAILFKQLNEPLPLVQQFRQDLDEGIDLVLQRATQKDASLRYDNVLAFAHALLRLVPPDDATIKLQSPTQEAQELVRAKNPYKGLRAFQIADSDDFFGRDTLVEKLLHRLSITGANENFLAVIGASGSGKSSLVKAGMLPKIHTGALDKDVDWYIAEMIPGSHPLEDLEAALLGIAMSPMPNLLDELRRDERGLVRIVKRLIPENGQLVLLIDQFEEVFTLIADEEERDHFLKTILRTVEDPRSHLKIIITLRADFYDRPLLYAEFGELIRQHTELILRLNDQELEAVILGPAKRVGLQIDSALMNAIIADVFKQPGALPLLQYALTELFERREGHSLSLDAYRDIGGVMGALTRRADELYENFGLEEQAAARQLFLRLVNLGEGTDDTRRRVYQADLLSIANREAMQKVLEQYGKYRLLSFDHDPQTRASTVELAHEALIRQWQRLREWLDADREALRLHRRLSVGAEEWLQAKHDPSFLAQGIRMQQFESLQVGSIVLSQGERDYLRASLEAYNAHAQAESQRQAREQALQKQSAQRLTLLAAVMSIAALISVFLASFAFQAQNQAQEQAHIAATEAAIASDNEARAVALQREAQSRLLTSQLPGILSSDPALAYSLGIEMLSSNPNLPSTARYGINNLFLANFVIREFFGHQQAISDVAFAPDGKTALSSSQQGQILLWDIETASIIGELLGHSAWVPSIQVSPDGSRALSASMDKTLILWDLESREAILTLEGDEGFRIAKFSPDGQEILAGDDVGNLILWDANTGEELRRLEGHSARVWDISIAPNGLYALSGSTDKSAILWNLQTGDIEKTYPYESDVVSLAFVDTEYFVLSTNNRIMELWRIASEEAILSYTPLGASAWGMSISADGQSLVTVVDNGDVEVWDLFSGYKYPILKGHRGFGTGVAISPDAQAALSVAEDQTMFLWDLGAMTAHRQWFTMSNRATVASSGSLASDNQHFVTGLWDGTVHLWDIESGERLQTIQASTAPEPSAEATETAEAAATPATPPRIMAVAYAPDASTVLTGSEFGEMILWDAETGEEIMSFAAHTSRISNFAYLPDSQSALSAAADGTMYRWDLQTGEILRGYQGHTDAINWIDLSPDGTKLLTGSSDSSLILWNLETGEVLQRYSGHRRTVNAVAFSPDGSHALSASEDSRLILWNLETGEAVREFLGHTGSVTVLDFAPDGLTAVSATNGGVIFLWDIASGEVLRQFEGKNWMVYLRFLPDSQQFVSLAGDGRLEIWQAALPTSDLIDWARENRHISSLSCEDLLQYYLRDSCEETSQAP
jgi:WD40 repeat protein/serine/threonine protein kinase